MTIRFRRLIWVGFLVLASGAAQGLNAQIELGYTLKYSSGQDIQPIFEGWSRNPDGSFAMHFGYLNRNFVEELHVPIGPENNVEPGGPDRGQPTFFNPRINRHLFAITVPKEWGGKELVWTVTVRGKTQKATAWLQPEWEIDPAGGASAGGRTGEDRVRNAPPTIGIGAVPPITLPDTLTLSAEASDDGLPKPGPRTRKPAVGQETPPILQGPTDAPVNVPDLPADARGGRSNERPQGLTVSWIVWRGPARVTFDPRSVAAKDGSAVVTATFTTPGSYVLRARANDGLLSAYQSVTVNVNGPQSSNQP
jgi:hypothetical protein